MLSGWKQKSRVRRGLRQQRKENKGKNSRCTQTKKPKKIIAKEGE